MLLPIFMNFNINLLTHPIGYLPHPFKLRQQMATVQLSRVQMT